MLASCSCTSMDALHIHASRSSELWHVSLESMGYRRLQGFMCIGASMAEPAKACVKLQLEDPEQCLHMAATSTGCTIVACTMCIYCATRDQHWKLCAPQHARCACMHVHGEYKEFVAHACNASQDTATGRCDAAAVAASRALRIRHLLCWNTWKKPPWGLRATFLHPCREYDRYVDG